MLFCFVFCFVVLFHAAAFAVRGNIWRVIKTRNYFWLPKYARIVVLGHYLFLKAHSCPRANCLLLGTDNILGQLSVHISSPKVVYCLCIRALTGILYFPYPCWSEYWLCHFPLLCIWKWQVSVVSVIKWKLMVAWIYKILFSPLKTKIHIFVPLCNILYVSLFLCRYLSWVW